MKNTFYIMLMAVVIIIACQSKPKIGPVDTATAKDEVIKVLEKFHSASNARDANGMTSMLVNEGLYCGTDSEELWDKSTFSDLMTRMFADTSIIMKYSIDKREVRIATDASSAITLEQCFVKDIISHKIPVRFISHLVKTGDDWNFDFFSWSLIPDNEDLEKLNKALE